MTAIWQDVKIGARLLVKQPAFSAVIIATLALAIGANTVIFGFANILLLRPLPVGEPETLAWISGVDPQRSDPRSRVAWQDYEAWRDGVASLSALAAWHIDTATLTGRGEPQRLVANRATANLFDVWRLRFALGRPYRPAEDRPGAPCAAVLAHRFWLREFAGASSALNETITLDGRSCTIVGVLAPEIEFGNLADLDVWLPVAIDPAKASPDRRLYRTVGRMKPGATLQQVAAEAQAVSERLQREHPRSHAGWTSHVLGTRDAITGPNTWLLLTLLLVVVGLVLLIACANVANLLLARSTGRRGELAVRAALGASRMRIVRQLVVEAIVLGIAGGGAGLLAGAAGMRLVRAFSYDRFLDLLEIDANVVAFAVALSFAAPLLFSLLPAFHSTAAAPGDVLKSSATRTTTGAARRSRHALVVGQVALAIILLVVAGLVVRTMIAITRIDLGMDPRQLLTLQLDLPEWRHADDEIGRFYERLLADLARVPGVKAAGGASFLPLIDSAPTVRFDIEGRPSPSEEARPWAGSAIVTNGYFSAASTSVLRGRAFSTDDREGARRVAVLNEEAARRYWSTVDAALGARLNLASNDGSTRTVHVVGIVANVANSDVDQPPEPLLYLPFAQRPVRALVVLLRTDRPLAVSAAARAVIRTADPALPIYQMRTLEAALDEEMSGSWMLTALFVSFAVLALVLASTGLYGVMAFSVNQRSQEIGVRVALGALPSDIRRLIFREALGLLALGSALGLLGAMALAQTLSSELYGVTAFDLVTYAGSLAAVLASAAVATWVPTRRAIRLDPVRCLRMLG